MKKPPFYIPQCEDAKLLVNPRALYLLQQGGRPSHPILRLPGAYSDPGTVAYYYSIANSRLLGTKDYRRLDDLYVQDNYCQFEYVFTIAKCGKCALCARTRQLDIVNRCRMESELYDTPAYCFCLTYDSAHLPGARPGMSCLPGRIYYPDVQRFLKRLRRNWDKAGVKHSIRYMVACEYGSRRHRPHYHFLLWNNPYGADEWKPWLQEKLMRDIFNAWQMQSWDVFSSPDNFRVAGDGAAAYAAKYASKQSRYRLDHHLPPGYPPPSIHMSISHGGLGRPFIERFRSYLHANPTVDRLAWTSRRDGRYHEVKIGSYIKSVIWPSPTRQIPAQIKAAYRELCQVLEISAADGVLDPDYARMLASQLRPPHLPNQLPTLPRYPRPHCWLYKVWRLNAVVWPVLEWLNNYLSSYQLSPWPVSLAVYYAHASVQKQAVDSRGSLAGELFRAKSEQSFLESKSRL